MSTRQPTAAVAQRLPLRRLLVVIAGVYTIQSTVGAIMFHGVPAILRDGGVALDMIGLVSLFMLPWTIKFLWSSVVERWRLAPNGVRRSRPIIVVGQIAMALLLAALAWTSPGDNFIRLFAGLGILAMIAATVDIASDGYTIEHLEPSQRGWGNVVQVGGGYTGFMVGGGLLLALAGWYGWQTAMLSMAILALFATLPSLLTKEPSGDAETQSRHRPSLSFALRRKTVLWGLFAMVLSQLGLRLTQSMSGPFMIDNGISPAQLGVLLGTLGTMLCLACVVLIGLPIRRWGPRQVLFVLLGAQFVVYGLFALAAGHPLPTDVLSALFLSKTAISAVSFVALYAVAMSWTSPYQAGIDFTLFQCADALVSAIAGFSGGLIAQHLGYGFCFGLAATLVLVSLLTLPRVMGRISRGQLDEY